MRFALIPSIATSRVVGMVFASAIYLALGAALIFWFGALPLGIFFSSYSAIHLVDAICLKVPRNYFNKLALSMGVNIGIPAFACVGFLVGSLLFPVIGSLYGTLIGIAVGAVLAPILSLIIAHILDALNLTDPGGIKQAHKTSSGYSRLWGMVLGAIIGSCFTPIGTIVGMLAGGTIFNSLNTLWAGISGTYNPAYNLSDENHSKHNLTEQAIAKNLEIHMPGINDTPEKYPGSFRIGKIFAETVNPDNPNTMILHYQLPSAAEPQQVIAPRY
jgi:hypothetical protein